MRVSSTNGCPVATSANATLTIAAPDEATATTSGTKVISAINTIISDASCNLIAAVVPSGAAPVSGNVSATVTITSTVQTSANGSPYVQRHYDIVPSTNASTATATLTLYFTQAEFTAYNAAPNHGTNLPVDAADAANNKSNLRVFQFRGTGTNPDNYTGSKLEINPADNLIIWNGTYARWEITFSITGFSGFYLGTVGNNILPLRLISFTGNTDGSKALLQWKTAIEINVKHFEVERSTDVVGFAKIGQVTAGTNDYLFTDNPALKIQYYYRLRVVDNDGSHRYSPIVVVKLKEADFAVQVLPNPFIEKLLLIIRTTQTTIAEVALRDMNGKLIRKWRFTLQTGTNSFPLTNLSLVTKGAYLLSVQTPTVNETIKVIKTD